MFVLLILLLVVAAYSLTIGEMDIPISKFIAVLSDRETMEFAIISKLRVPRMVLALSAGGALSLTGALLQGIYRNPLVEPYTLGISGGSALGVALVIVLGWHTAFGSFMLPVFGFAGSLCTIFLVYFLSIRKGEVNINRMLLIGVMISFVSSSAMMFLMAVTTAENLHGIVFWMMGSLDEPNMALVHLMWMSSLFVLIVSFFFARPLNALRLGDTKARHLGVNTVVTIRILFIMASLLTGICVSVVGIIGFVGLVVPHVIKILMGHDYRFLLLSSFLGGGLFLVTSDIIARSLIAPNELPIGVITGLVGGVLFIILLSRKKRRAI